MKVLTTVFLLCFLILHATYSYAAEPTNQSSSNTVNPLSSNEQLIARYYPEDQVIWLNADTQQGLLIHHPNTIEKNYGKILVVSDSGSTTKTPGFNHKISRDLPKLGWNVYHLYQPHKDPIDSTTPSNQADFATQINQAVNVVQQSSNFKTYILVKNDAITSFFSLIESQPLAIDGVIIVASQPIDFSSEKNLNSLVTLNVPIYAYTPSNISSQTKSWLITLQKRTKQSFTHYKMPNHYLLDSDAAFFANRIHGWLKTLIQSSQ